MREFSGKAVVQSQASGVLRVSHEPLSFWGGYRAEDGEIIDRTHPLSGVIAAGSILVIPETRGSSTTTAVLLESIRRGTAPAGFVTLGVDSFLALAAVVAEEMYGSAPPIIALDPDDFRRVVDSGLGEAVIDGGILTIS